MRTAKLRLRLLESGAPAYVIAGRAGIAPTRLSEYCMDKRQMPQRHVIALCQVLQCNPDDILGWEETADFRASGPESRSPANPGLSGPGIQAVPPRA